MDYVHMDPNNLNLKTSREKKNNKLTKLKNFNYAESRQIFDSI
jgi:hypothetical protein